MAFSISSSTTTAITGLTLISKAKNRKPSSPMTVTFCNRNRSISFDTADDSNEEKYCSIKGNRSHMFHYLLGKPLGSLFFLNPFGVLGDEEKNRYYEVKSIKEGMFVRMDLPGIEEDDVKISVMNNDDIVYVKGEEREKQSEHDTEVRSYEGMVELLPPGCYKTNEIDAHLKNGVLRMVIPRKV